MTIDLDQMIRDADPGRHLHISTPDPRMARTSLRAAAPRRGLLAVGVVAPAVSVLVVAAIVTVVLVLSGHHDVQTPQPASSGPPLGRVLVQTADPSGGLPWGLEVVHGSGQRVCLRVGRVKNDRLGTITSAGQRTGFEPLADHPVPTGQSWCTFPDADGNMFVSVVVPIISANGPNGGNATTAQRTLEFGLYGPDLMSVTSIDAHQHLETQQTGSGGSFLVVLPRTSSVCRTGAKSCITLNGGASTGIGPGPITKLTYRDGTTCQLTNGAGRPCPAQGRVLAPTTHRAPIVPERKIAAPVTATPIPARYYCQPRHSRDFTDLVPCNHGTPPGDGQIPGTAGAVRNGRTIAPEEIVQISFTARLATGSRRRYEYSYANPCGGGGGGGSAAYGPVRAGQRVTIRSFFPVSCRGRYTGEVTYAPRTGPPALGRPPTSGGAVVVGHFSFTLKRN
jgi:hypothetical protein